MINYQKKFFLNNTTSIVLGGAGLIGEQASFALSNMGSNIIILDIDKKKGKSIANKISKNGGNASYIFFNCNNERDIKKNFLKIIKKKLNASIFVDCSYPRTKDWKKNNFDQISLESLKKNISTNLSSSIWLSKVFAENLVKQKKAGSIIHFGSIYGVLGQDINIYENTNMRENITYSAVKGGIVNYTRQMASYYGKKNIRVNSISPGGVIGPVQGVSKKQNKNFIRSYEKKVPIGRLAESSEIASVITFLASPAASYINGANIMVDGGWSIV